MPKESLLLPALKVIAYTAIMLILTYLWTIGGRPYPSVSFSLVTGVPLAIVFGLSLRQGSVVAASLLVAASLDRLMNENMLTQVEPWTSVYSLTLSIIFWAGSALMPSTIKEGITLVWKKQEKMNPDREELGSYIRFIVRSILILFVFVANHFAFGMAWSTNGIHNIKKGSIFYEYMLSDYIKTIPVYMPCDDDIEYDAAGVDGVRMSYESVSYRSHLPATDIYQRYCRHFSGRDCANDRNAPLGNQPDILRYPMPSPFILAIHEGNCREVHLTVYGAADVHEKRY